MLVLDGLAILVAHVAEDVLPSLGDLLCHHHHYQCQSIECDSESGDSSQVTQQMSRVGAVTASVSEQVSHASVVRYICTRTRGHLESFIESRVVLHCLEIFGAQSKFPLLVALVVVDGVVDGVFLAGATL